MPPSRAANSTANQTFLDLANDSAAALTVQSEVAGALEPSVIASSVSNAVAVSVGVSIAVSTAVAVAGSVAGATASGIASAAAGSAAAGAAGGGAVGGAAGGATGGAAGGGGGAAIASAMPLLLSAQRFAASEGLAANLSETHSAVTDSLSWTSGDVGIQFDRTRRQLAETAEPKMVSKAAKAFNSLINILCILGSVQTFIFILYILVQHYWRRHANRRFYAEINRFSFKSKKLKFVPFPSLFVFPGLAMVGLTVFITALASKSTALLVIDEPDVCGAGCKGLAGSVLSLIVFFEMFSFSMLIRFNARFRLQAWKGAAMLDDPSKIVDPLYRLMSKARARLCQGHFSRMDRTRGKFAKPKDDAVEPARTERILSQPWALLKPTAGDSLDAYGFSLMARAGGFIWYATSFEVTILSTQIVVGVLNGLGAALQPGSSAAIAQISTVLAVQAMHSIWVFTAKPSVDRIMNVLVGTQFALEACQTAMILLVIYYPPAPVLQATSLVLALLSVLAPILQRFYDAIVVQLVKLYAQGGFNPKAAFFAMIGFLVFIPSMIFKLLGIQTEGKDALARNAGDNLNKLSAKTANEVLVGEIEQKAEEVVANAFWAAEKRRAEKREKAATFIQQRFRERKARQMLEAMKTEGSVKWLRRKRWPKRGRKNGSGGPHAKKLNLEESSCASLSEWSQSEISERSSLRVGSSSTRSASVSTARSGSSIDSCLGACGGDVEVADNVRIPPTTMQTPTISVQSLKSTPPLGGAILGLSPDGTLEVRSRASLKTVPPHESHQSGDYDALVAEPTPGTLSRRPQSKLGEREDSERPGARWLREQLSAIDVMVDQEEENDLLNAVMCRESKPAAATHAKLLQPSSRSASVRKSLPRTYPPSERQSIPNPSLECAAAKDPAWQPQRYASSPLSSQARLAVVKRTPTVRCSGAVMPRTDSTVAAPEAALAASAKAAALVAAAAVRPTIRAPPPRVCDAMGRAIPGWQEVSQTQDNKARQRANMARKRVADAMAAACKV